MIGRCYNAVNIAKSNRMNEKFYVRETTCTLTGGELSYNIT